MDAQAALGPRPDTIASYDTAFQTLSKRQQRAVRRDDFLAKQFGIAFCLIGALIVVSVSIVCWQSFEWLKTGAWPALDIVHGLRSVGVAETDVPWVGVRRIIAAVLELPLIVVPMSIAVLIVLFAVRDDNSSDLKQAREILRRRN